MTVSMHSERLFLQRDGSDLDIYIDLPKPLPQHQLDGVRFLYRHFKKKTPGIILNDPSGYGKCYQVVSFLNAMRPVLKKPILILSNETNNWKEQFEKIWGNCVDELSVGALTPSSKKLVHINKVEDGLNFGGRCWSIVVLHDLDCTKELLKTSFYSDYKIWVTSTDLKNDLRVLSSIYEWLHPNQKFNTNDFIANKHDMKDVLDKTLLLDSFLEDFLIRRNAFKTPFRKDRYQKPAPAIQSPAKTTRKNKDPTGTKVKRSKKRIIEDDDIEQPNIVFAKRTVPNNNEILIKSNSKNMDVENFIRDEKPISSEGFMDFAQDSNGSSESITVTVNASKDLDFGVLDDFLKDNNTAEHSDNGPVATENNDNDSQSIFEPTQSNLIPDKVVVGGNNVIVPGTEDSEDSPNILVYTETHDNNSVIDENNGTNKNITIIPETDQSEDTQSEDTKNILQFENNDSKEILKSQNSSNWSLSDVTNKRNETESQEKLNNDKIIKASENVGDANDNMDCKNNKNGNVKDESNILSDIEAKLAEHEAMALKRFKGTFLDRLF